MKKLSSLLLAGLFTVSITACGQESNITQIQGVQQPNKVATYSNVGLKSAFSVVISSMFKAADRNKDKSVTLDEYKSMFPVAPPAPVEPPAQPVPSEPVAPPAEDPAAPPAPTTNPDQTATQVQTLAKKTSIPTDPAARFSRMDKNKNGKLTASEVNAMPTFFIPGQKDALKKAARINFDMFDKNKNGAISREEFLSVNMAGNTPSAQAMQSLLFYTADLNINGSLGITEFEDIVYSSIRSYFNGNSSGPVAPPPSEPAQPVPSEPVAPPAEDPAPAQPADPAQPAQP